MEGKFITLMAPHRRSNRRLLDFGAPIEGRYFVNRASCAGYADGSTFQKKYPEI
jgi:hypothetical protein